MTSRPFVPSRIRRKQYADKFSLPAAQAYRLLTHQLDQLDNCKDDEARRILLGVGEK